MAPVQCAGCGLANIDGNGGSKCYALGRVIDAKELRQRWACHYYLPVIEEDGRPLTPFQHYLLKQDEIDRKK
ncbi:hypothetical protein [Thermincola potens]|uniref:Uncharacterized protein n=1 Tax=Thermincola potens (strain JR) TaxID=635013 RepID=D5XB21_THEPJ|nr:hypothetical protein [Thermincola potens]ADG81341.1 hypothetical protein TherJR_0459 [Thermincola potens JR]